jgi:hypothetical protein
MVASATTAADIVNIALVRIGWKQPIGNLYDGSAAAQLALNLYGQTRDELLRKMEPGFSMRNVAMTLLKAAPPGGYIPGITPWDQTLYPPVNWLFEYAYPDGCLKARAVKPTPMFFPNVDPSPNVFSIDNDNAYAPPKRVILCNIENALLVYTGRVTDPSTMDVGFIEALTETLGERLAPGLTGLDAAKLEGAEAQAETAMVEMEQG